MESKSPKSSSGKVYQTSQILPDAFVHRLQCEARKMNYIERAKSRKEWLFGELVNAQWDELPDDIRAEISREMYWMECSRIINAALPFPLVSASGETLRRWCEVSKAYENTMGIDALKDTLSFDHFVQARRLANIGKVSFPVAALAHAVEMHYTADEMRLHFDPPQKPTEYDRATGWIDSLFGLKFEFLKRDAREKVMQKLGEIQQIVVEAKG